MAQKARLFKIEDVVSTLTGAPLRGDSDSASAEMLSYVAGSPIGAEESGACRGDVIEALKHQLPRPLANFTILDLARLVTDVKTQVGAAYAKGRTIERLQEMFGALVPLCPRSIFEGHSAELKALRDLADRDCLLSFDDHPGAFASSDDDRPDESSPGARKSGSLGLSTLHKQGSRNADVND
jgi:hypothetical protein